MAENPATTGFTGLQPDHRPPARTPCFPASAMRPHGSPFAAAQNVDNTLRNTPLLL